MLVFVLMMVFMLWPALETVTFYGLIRFGTNTKSHSNNANVSLLTEFHAGKRMLWRIV